jgi:glycosyltransferase involved in cell wall biosynthesis
VPGITATLITLNESANIAAALESVRWADEIIVVDAESTDETVAIARRYTDRVIVRPWPGYVEQKNFAASQATHDWIFSLDADERVTPELAAEIRALVESGPPCAGYRMPRVNHFLGRWIRSTDWYPDYQLRLYDRRRAKWAGRYVHESVRADGDVGRLRTDLRHHSFRDVAHHVQSINHYSSLAARQMFEDGRRTGALGILPYAGAAFLRNYLLRGGVTDGAVGLIVSLLNSYYVALKFVKLWELCSHSTSTPPAPGDRDRTRSS